MNQQDKIKMKNKSSLENNHNKLSFSQKKLLKTKLIKKYNLSEKEAEIQLIKIENMLLKKNQNKTNKSNIQKSNEPKKKSNNEHEFSNSKLEITTEQNKQRKNIYDKIKPSQNTNNKQNKINNNSLNKNTKETTNQQNVDSILTDIIPDYNKHVSIELKNVDLIFEIETDKVDTIKGEFIRTLKGIKKDKKQVHALKNISFKIYKGEKIGIIGYNGAGKSTLLNVISGIYSPNKGSVETYGKISPLLGLGAGFDNNYSGARNIFLNGAVLGYDKEFISSKYDEIVEFSELEDAIDLPIKNYSNGMLTKLGFAIATVVEPDILIIDEILGVGDVNFRKKSSAKMKSLMDGGTTVLLVSHSIPQIREICDKAIWIDNGEIREIGEVNKVCDHYIKDAEKASKKQLANIQLVNEQ